MIYYKAVSHIAIKKDQDRTASTENTLIICDGIGEFNQSQNAAEILIENLLLSEFGDYQEIQGLLTMTQEIITSEKIRGGTTMIFAAIIPDKANIRLKFSYLGNGAIIQLPGDFSELPSSYGVSNKYSRYSNLLIPHVDKDGILLKHISHHSEPEQLIPSFIELIPSGIYGDIILIFSDGICSLEDEIGVQDEYGRIWRNQSEAVVLILEELHDWIKLNFDRITNENLHIFILKTLQLLKDLKKIDDDASFGLIISEKVLHYYRKSYA
jgi:hypothetical protein